MNRTVFFDTVIPLLRKKVAEFEKPVVTKMTENGADPFKVLISTIISLRTKDTVTEVVSGKLFKRAGDPFSMLKLSEDEIAQTIYPAGFYKNKAATIRNVCDILISKYEGKVPDDLDELLSLKGVGRKTANLVVTMGYGKPGICVDTHVHRISNRFGVLKTRTPDETEMVLRKILPKKYWIEYNDLLVTYGQNLCKPISPLCSQCPLTEYCARTGVEKHR